VQTELTARFGVGSSTVSHALGCLIREGFVEARRGAGCVVRDDPPHLNNIVVAVPQRRIPDRYWSNYYVAVGRVVGGLREESGRPIRLIEGLESPDDLGRIELEHLARTHQVAGIVFVSHPFMLKGTAILDEPGIPRLAVASRQSVLGGIDTNVTVNSAFMEKALEYLIGKGRRKIAVMFNGTSPAGAYQEGIRSVLAASGVNCPPYWQIPINIGSLATARAVTRLLMHGGAPSGRPDGLIVVDDNLVNDAVAGLVEEGIRLPEEVEVVAHCNFPWTPFTVAPIRRLGSDIEWMLRECIKVIDARRAGQAAPAVIEAPTVWEEERG
jgi:DNA-binding LacI/PurR family transcriptional regulator